MMIEKTTTSGKKVIFDSSSDSDVEVKKPRLENGDKKKNGKMDLLGESDDDQEQETIQMFESKINLDDKKATKLMQLKSKFATEEDRFKIDDRFVEDEDDDGERVDDGKKKPSSKEQIKSEHLSSLKILETIVGKQLVKPSSAEEKSKKAKSAALSNRIVRFDPNKTDHKIYEINNDDAPMKQRDSSDDSSASSSSDEESDKEAEQDSKVDEKVSQEDTSKFYQIEPNLKDLFSSSDVFKFKFATPEVKVEDVPEKIERPAAKSKFNILDEISFGKSVKKDKRFDSSDEEDDEGSDESDREQAASKTPIPKITRTVSSESRVVSFLPEFDQDKQISEALVYFFRRGSEESAENIKEEWLKSRELLVKEYKKKHKRMLRIKKGQDNEKLLPWRKTVGKPKATTDKRKK